MSTPNDLTKREYFAAMALQGMLANQKTWGGSPDIKAVKDSVVYSDWLIKILESNHVD